ncbi:MAG: class I adenylate-forming enzyme family protein [Solirubrobacteraceae bacterium]
MMIANRQARGQVVATWLAAQAHSSPEAVAIEYLDEAITYGHLHHRAVELADKLSGLGLDRGSRIGTIADNDADQVILFFACAICGFILVPLNWRLTGTELTTQLNVVAPALVAASDTHIDLARSAVDASAFPSPVGYLRDLVEAPTGVYGRGHTSEACVAGDEDPLLIIFTSGSTGRPKGAVLTNANCVWTNMSLDRVVPLSSNDVVLQVLPQCHVSGWNVQPLQAWLKGATVIIEPRFDPGRTLSLIETRRVTTMMGVPTIFRMLAEDPAFETADLTSLRRVVVGGATMPRDLLHIWRQRDVDIHQGYGLTEAGPNVLCLTAKDATAHPASVGRPYPFVDVELHEPDTGLLIAGAGTGELWVSGPNVFAGYWKDNGATTCAMTGRWLRTGDLAKRDDQGFYRICGRLAECFRSGGEDVYPADVEMVLRDHKDVRDAAVVGVRDPRWGEIGVAFIEPKTGHTLSEEQLIAYCRNQLAGFKVPRRITIVSQLPRLVSGKLDKHRLADMAERAHV